MRDLNFRKSEYQMFSEYIDEAISNLLRNKDMECMKVLETLKLLSHSILNIKHIFNED